MAATCSCAGVPLLTSIDTSAKEKGDFYLNFSTEYHQISDLVEGSQDVQDETGRDRNTLSQVISASYAMSDRWSVSALISYVEHNRTIQSSFFGKETTSGVGDSVVLLRYTPLFITPFSRHELSLGLGARIPTGDDNVGSGFVVSEDMQPSVGASAKIGWSSYSYAFNQAATVLLNVSASYTESDPNDRQYAFGNEFSYSLGISQSVGTKFGYSAALRYRSTKADRRFDFAIPNTGGDWLDFVPAVQYSVNDNLKLGLFGRIPVSRDLNGTLQFTTSYSYGLSLTYGF
jgi:hypothetical protein